MIPLARSTRPRARRPGRARSRPARGSTRRRPSTHRRPGVRPRARLPGVRGRHRRTSAPDERILVMRVGGAHAATGAAMVVADLPVDHRRRRATSRRDRARGWDRSDRAARQHVRRRWPDPRRRGAGAVRAACMTLFAQTVAFMDCTDWRDGRAGRAWRSASTRRSAGSTAGWRRRSRRRRSRGGVGLRSCSVPGARSAILFLIIQGSALVMGGLLARSITSAVHELFVGTERVQQGDFAHRITIESRRPARRPGRLVQPMSAQHRAPAARAAREAAARRRAAHRARDPEVAAAGAAAARWPASSIADLCEPAREVGGDYYDFFELGPRRLGVLIADVSGKGTSAALYMAELKGLMLSLSHTRASRRGSCSSTSTGCSRTTSTTAASSR